MPIIKRPHIKLNSKRVRVLIQEWRNDKHDRSARGKNFTIWDENYKDVLDVVQKALEKHFK